MKFDTSITTMLLVAAALTVVPTAAAHDCTWEEGTASDDTCAAPCPDGQAHNHSQTHHHENGWAPDESHVHYECSSSEQSDPECPTPRVMGICPIQTVLSLPDNAGSNIGHVEVQLATPGLCGILPQQRLYPDPCMYVPEAIAEGMVVDSIWIGPASGATEVDADVNLACRN